MATAPRLRPAAFSLWLGLLLFFAVFLVYPVGFMLREAFFDGGRFTLGHFTALLANPVILASLGNSFVVATLTTALATAVSLPLAHVMTRFRFRGQGVFHALLLVPMIMPPFVGAIGLRQLLARYGSLNLTLMDLGWMDPARPVDWLGASGLWGVVILQVFNLYPILFLNVAAAMANVDPALRESAQNLGAGPLRLFRSVTLPLILPGWFAGAVIVFIWSFTDLGTPLIFGLSNLVPVQIFDSILELNTNPAGYALVVFVLVLTLALFVVSKRLLASRSHAMLARGHTAGAAATAGRWATWAIWAALGLFVAVALVPHVTVIVQAFAGRWFMSPLPDAFTTENFAEVFGRGGVGLSIRNSLFYSGLSAGLDLVLGVAIAWLLTRRRVPAAGLLDALAMLPLALPGLVIAFGYVAAFDFPLPWLNPRENPTLLLVISYSVRRLPYIVRAAYAGFQQTSVTLEEASASVGAAPWRTLRRVTLPLVAANLVAGTILTFSLAMLEVSDGLILAMREEFYPITKMIWLLMSRIEPSAASVACALGVVGMVILGGSLFLAARVLGQRLGQLFRS